MSGVISLADDETQKTVSAPLAYYEPASKGYLVQNTRKQWIQVTEGSLRRQLKPYFREKENKELLSPLDAHLNRLQLECDVAYAGPLAGSASGLRESKDGRRLLITEGPRIIDSRPGEWTILSRLLENLLIDEFMDQRPYFYGWMKVAREALRNGKSRAGQALVIAGSRDCGKSLLQNLITHLLGGRSAKPYGWMAGLTDFNSELFEAEHLMIEDEVASNDLRSRRNFGAQLKSVTVNTVQKCHRKNRPALSMEPFWRLSVTVNDEPENLMVLPPIDDSIEDKIILLRANRKPMPMPTVTQDERDAFWGRLILELPAFCHFLDSWEIPDDLVSSRFGITHYHHPALLAAIDALQPENKLLQLIDVVFLSKESVWAGTAAELETGLTGNQSQVCHEARRLLSFPTACGTYLGRLAKKCPDQVEKDRTANSRRWILRRGNQ